MKRTAYKDNSSDYYLDNRKVQFKEVGALLRECGVDLDHNRFLILQVIETFLISYELADLYTFL